MTTKNKAPKTEAPKTQTLAEQILDGLPTAASKKQWMSEKQKAAVKHQTAQAGTDLIELVGSSVILVTACASAFTGVAGLTVKSSTGVAVGVAAGSRELSNYVPQSEQEWAEIAKKAKEAAIAAIS